LIIFFKKAASTPTQSEKINNFKNNTLKFKRVEIFLNLNSFEVTLKMLKMMKIQQEYIFFNFFVYWKIL